MRFFIFLFYILMLHCHIHVHAEIYIYMYWIHTDAMITDAIQRRRKTSLTKYLPLTLFVSFKRVVQSLRVRGSWRPNITEIFWPQSYGRPRCVFLVVHGCSNGALEFTLLGAGFPYYTSSISVSNSTRLNSTVLFCSICRPYITFKLPCSDMDTTPRLCNFIRSLAIGMCHFRYLWNGLCDGYQAEITVMQFRGHSLPVRQSMRV